MQGQQNVKYEFLFVL